jgi:hypothetical protein
LGEVDLIGYFAGALCVACVLALFVAGDRRVRIAVVVFVGVVVIGLMSFETWTYLVGRD